MSVKIHEEIGGYNMNLFVGKTEDELNEVKCGICFEVCRNPKQCPNGHMHCDSCTQRLQQSNRCPDCRVITETWCDNLFVKNLISKMTVKCVSALNENQDDGRQCDWYGLLSDLGLHVHKDCQLTVVKCPFDNCQHEMFRADLAEHEAECPYRLVKCKHCNTIETFSIQKEHEVQCEWRPVKCNQDCGMTMPAMQLEFHTANDCPLTEVKCSMFQLVRSCKGCEGTVLRRDSESHLIEGGNLAGNFNSLLKHCANLMTNMATNKEQADEQLNLATQKIDNLASQLEECSKATDKGHTRLSNRIQNTHIKLNSVKRELQSVKLNVYIASLQHTKEMFVTTNDLRWQHDALLCKKLERWSRVFDPTTHAHAIAFLNKQLSASASVDTDTIVRYVALEVRAAELSIDRKLFTRIGDTKVTIYPGHTVSVFVSEISSKKYQVTAQTEPRIQASKVSVSLLGPQQVFESNDLSTKYWKTDLTDTIDGTIRILCTLHVKKSSFECTRDLHARSAAGNFTVRRNMNAETVKEMMERDRKRQRPDYPWPFL